ncbi:FMN-binding negative transcriptional regulator [Mucilaginibacter koreensis]
MYIPKQNLMASAAEAVAFMQKYSFATLVTSIDDIPFATHLPFVVKHSDYGSIQLLAHLAKANPHAEHLEKQTSLVIFNEPHAYISPSLYDKELNVPTWNYLAVHAYGKAQLINDSAEEKEVLVHMIQQYEQTYLQQWDKLPDDYKNRLLNGIVSFKIEVTDLQGKKKLSQNKTLPEQQRIIAALQSNNNKVVSQVGDYMAAELKQ